MKLWLAILLSLSPSALAAGAAGNTFPQSVRVGDLVGQQLVAPRESQALLGHVEGIERRDGALAVRIRTWSLLPWNSRTVDVPIGAVSYLGPQLALTGLTEAQLQALPPAALPTPVPADEAIQMGVIRPFH